METPQQSPSMAYNIAKKVIATLEEQGFQARLAGGCVRDRLMGILPKDFDVATDAHPAKVLELFRKNGFKSIPTGIDHGTVTVVQAGIPIEVTTLRADVETDGRRAVVQFSKSFEDDAQRRDFTINAMYEDAAEKIYDYYQGQDDLKAKQLRFVGDAAQRVREDYLRILRMYRFWSRLGFQPDGSARQACRELAEGLCKISQERITSELLQILNGKDRCTVLSAMLQDGIWNVIEPEVEIQTEALKALAATFLEIPEELRAIAAFAVLLNGSRLREPTDQITNRLRLSNAHSKLVVYAVDGIGHLPGVGDDQAGHMAFIDQAESIGGPGAFLDFFVPVWEACPFGTELHAKVRVAKEIEKRLGALRKSKPLLTSAEVMKELNIGPGKALGDILRALMQKQRNQMVSSRDEALEWLHLHCK